jgi:hypothetical protein
MLRQLGETACAEAWASAAARAWQEVVEEVLKRADPEAQ